MLRQYAEITMKICILCIEITQAVDPLVAAYAQDLGVSEAIELDYSSLIILEFQRIGDVAKYLSSSKVNWQAQLVIQCLFGLL